MSDYVIVWNESKNEGVVFRKKPDGGQWGRGSKADAMHASGGKRCNPCSSLADHFRESYEYDKCTIQDVQIDETKSVSKRSYAATKA